MMHQWESLDKLVKNWEAQEVKDSFKYEEFKYELDEWDNVPTVLPRFQFYLQNCMKQTVDFTREVRDRQTTQQLKDEMYKNLDEHLEKIRTEEKARIDDITAATARKDDI